MPDDMNMLLDEPHHHNQQHPTEEHDMMLASDELQDQLADLPFNGGEAGRGGGACSASHHVCSAVLLGRSVCLLCTALFILPVCATLRCSCSQHLCDNAPACGLLPQTLRSSACVLLPLLAAVRAA
jgi:hypothetical protein